MLVAKLCFFLNSGVLIVVLNFSILVLTLFFRSSGVRPSQDFLAAFFIFKLPILNPSGISVGLTYLSIIPLLTTINPALFLFDIDVDGRFFSLFD